MATSYKDIKGRIAVFGRVQALPGKADELADLLARTKVYEDSDERPGTLQYSVYRYGDWFAGFELYEDVEALTAHAESPLAKELMSSGGTLTGPMDLTFYPADSIPTSTGKL